MAIKKGKGKTKGFNLDFLNRFLFLKPVLDLISNGKFFTTFFYWFLTIVGILVFLGVVAGSLKMWSMLPKGAPVEMTISLILLQILVIIIAYIISNIILVRAQNVRDLPESTDYYITPIFVILTKMAGEIIAASLIAVSISMALVFLIAGKNASMFMSLLPMSDMMGFARTGGIVAVLQGTTAGVIILVSTYFIAEQAGALVDIARNIRKMK